MTPEKIISYLRDPSLMKSGASDELWALVKEYPYFQIGRILLAKQLHDSDDKAYPLSLRLAAAYAGDRSKLKRLIEGKTKLLDEKEAKSGQDSFLQIENAGGILSTSDKKLADFSINSKAQDLNNEPEDSENKVNPENENKMNQAGSFIKNPLIENIFNRLSNVEIPEEIEEIGITKKEVRGTTLYSKIAPSNELVERFLRDEPRISPMRKEFFNPEDIARQSTNLPEDIVSETLAQIFENQGHYSLAIKIYDKLVLLIPEKSSYFASRIEELKQGRK
jgi:hypothetical protein